MLKTWNLIFFENLKIIGGKFLPGKFCNLPPVESLEATFYLRQVKLPGWITTNKVVPDNREQWYINTIYLPELFA